MKFLTKVLLCTLASTGVTGILYAAPPGTWNWNWGGNATGGNNPRYEEMVMRAHDMHDSMLEDVRHVQHLQAEARRSKDVVKLNCVNDKLVQMKPLMNDADRARGELEYNIGSRASFFGTIGGDVQEVHHLREEADECVGEGLLGTDTSNSFSAPGFPDSPYQNPWGPIGEPPGYASPFN